jgi:hypothetical protein
MTGPQRSLSSPVLGRVALGVALSWGVAACAEDPVYVDPKQNLEVGLDPTMAGVPATATITLPITIEKPVDATARAKLATEFGVDVPYVRLGDLAVSVEWTIKNLDTADGLARVRLNGGNEFFTYVPANFIVDPKEDPTPPPLVGDVPTPVPANGTVSGVFREDELREASIDLELITRGHMNPFAAMLQSQADITSYQPTVLIDPTMPDLGTMPVGMPIPIAAFAQQVQFDMSFVADHHMVMEYAIRVRDLRGGMMHTDLLDAPAGELTTFNPMVYVPPPPPPM